MQTKENRKKAGLLIVLVVIVLLLLAVVIALLLYDPHNAGKEIELGRKYLDDMEYEQALLAFTNAIEIDEKAVDAFLGRAQAYGALEQREDALADYAQAIDLAPERADEIRHLRHETVGSTAERPQTAADTDWTAGPANSCLDVEPVQPKEFVTRLERSSGRDKVIDALYAISAELSYPSYSYWDRYYCVYMPDGIHLFNMETQELSDFFAPSYAPKINELSAISWEGLTNLPENFVKSPSHGSWDVVGDPAWDSDYTGELIWDVPTQTPFFEEYRFGYSRFVQVPDARLHKNYPIQQGDLSTKVDVSAGKGEFDWTGAGVSRFPVGADRSPFAYDGDDADRYALLAPDGTLLTDFEYERMEASSCGLTAACRGGKWGYLDEKGQEITDFVYDAPWTGTETPDSGPIAYPATCDTMVVSKDGEYGVLYRDGSLLIDYGEFEELAPAWNDLLWAKENGQWGIVDLKAAKQNAGIWVEDADDAAAHSGAAQSGRYTVEDTVLYSNDADSEIHMLQITGLESPAAEKVNQALRETAEYDRDYVLQNIDENGVAQAYLSVTYEVLEASSTRLCVLHNSYNGYPGGMHGWSGLGSYIYDLTTGERLALADYADPAQLAHTLWQGREGEDYVLRVYDGTTMRDILDNARIYSEAELAESLRGYDGRGENGTSNGTSYWENGWLYLTFPGIYHAQGDYLLVRINFAR